jgi:hypothetical protein
LNGNFHVLENDRECLVPFSKVTVKQGAGSFRDIIHVGLASDLDGQQPLQKAATGNFGSLQISQQSLNEFHWIWNLKTILQIN